MPQKLQIKDNTLSPAAVWHAGSRIPLSSSHQNLQFSLDYPNAIHAVAIKYPHAAVLAKCSWIKEENL